MRPMAAVRELRSPPIVEAIVDLRAAVTGPLSAFEELAREVQADYPKPAFRRGVRAELRVEHGKLLPPTAEDLGFQGVWLTSESGNTMVQFRPDGFTFNNLNAYIGGGQLLTEAVRLWSLFAERLKPTSVARIALRYINQLRLPFKDGDKFEKYLTATPPTPDGAPQRVSEFLSRVVAQVPEISASVIVTQQLTYNETLVPLILLDVDASQLGEFSPDPQQLRTALDRLRILKNNTFFSLLTEDAVQLFL